MRILFPIGTFYPAQSGGPSNTMYWQAKALVNNGVEVNVVTTSKDIKKGEVLVNEWVNKDGINVIYIKEGRTPIRLLCEALKNISRNDIIHLTSLYDLISLPIAIVSLILKKKLIWSVRGELEVFARNYKSRYLKKFWITIIKVFKKKVLFHSTSHSETMNIRSVFGNNVSIVEIPNYIEMPKKLNEVEVQEQFLFIGRIHKIKAIHKLIEGLALSKKFKSSNFVLKVAGIGSKTYLKQLQLKIEEHNLNERVILLNRRVEGIEKEILYAQSYFSFLVSESENFGAVVVESMAQGTPVVTSTGTPWESLLINKIGYWIKNRPNEIANIIDLIIDIDKENYIKLRKNAYSHIVSEYDIRKKIHQWIEVYQQKIN